ncbi:MAG: response regulator [Magnetococcales bacterium]|nr:response regulator [Magnetococcales bacterium]
MTKPDKKIILLVDDTPDNIDVLSGLLAKEYKIKVALNGERALKIAASTPQPDLILLDIMMPVMDGLEVCNRLKANPNTQDIPVIFVTAKSESEDEKAGFDIGAVDYISKPIKPSVVQARVRTQLDLSTARREAERLLLENREMLDQTLVGAMRVISDLLSWANPAAFLRAARLRVFMEGMVEELKIPREMGWQLNLSATLSQIGLVALPAEEMNRYATGQGVSIKFLSAFKAQAEIGGRALQKVPRMESIAKVIEDQLKPMPEKGQYPEEITQRDVYTLGRQLLRVLIDFDHKLLGEKSSVALTSMANSPHYDSEMIKALNNVIKNMEWIPCALSMHKLTPGMVLDESTDDDTLSFGATLTTQSIDRLKTVFKKEAHFRLFRVKVPFKVDAQGNLPSIKQLQEPTPDPSNEQPTNKKAQLDKNAVKPLIKEIHAYLKDDDPAAKGLVTTLQELVEGTEIEGKLARIQESVSYYDFPEALELVEELANSIQIQLD